MTPATTPRTLRLIFCILLLDIVGLSLLWPVAPFIVQRFSGDAMALTLLMVLYAGGQFFAAPLLGKLADRYGRRRVLVLSLLGSAVGYVMFAVAGALWLLLLARLVSGLFAGNQSVAGACIGDLSTSENRARNFSLFGLAWGLGIIIGPALGALLGQVSLNAPAWMAAALSFAAALLSYRILPETLPPAARETQRLRWRDVNPFVAIWALLQRPLLGPLLLILTLFNLALNGYSSTQSLFMLQRFAVAPWQLGAVLVLAGIALSVVQAPAQWLNRKLGLHTVACGALAAVALLALLSAPPTQLWLFVVVVTLRMAATGLVFPSLNGAISAQVASREQGLLMGVSTALASLSSVFGPLAAGAVYDAWSPAAPYYCGAAVLLLATFWMLVLRGRGEGLAEPAK